MLLPLCEVTLEQRWQVRTQEDARASARKTTDILAQRTCLQAAEHRLQTLRVREEQVRRQGQLIPTVSGVLRDDVGRRHVQDRRLELLRQAGRVRRLGADEQRTRVVSPDDPFAAETDSAEPVLPDRPAGPRRDDEEGSVRRGQSEGRSGV